MTQSDSVTCIYMYMYIYFFQALFHCSLFKDINCSFYIFHKGKSETRVLGWTEDQMICIYTLGSLIRGKITGQKTTVSVVTGVLNLSLCPVLLLALPGLAEPCSVRAPSCVSTNSGGWQTFPINAELESTAVWSLPAPPCDWRILL